MLFDGCTIFEGLDEEDIKKLQDISSTKRYYKGQIIYYEQDDTNYLNYLKQGIVKIYKVDRYGNDIFLYNIYKNDFITELMSFESITCFSNAEAVEECEVIMINFDRFKEIFFESPAVIAKFYSFFLRRIKMLQCTINREMVFDGSAKVAHMLYNDIEMFNRLKKQEIAKMLNIQPETLSRILKKLSRDGIIEQSTGNVVIVDNNRLREVFE